MASDDSLILPEGARPGSPKPQLGSNTTLGGELSHEAMQRRYVDRDLVMSPIIMVLDWDQPARDRFPLEYHCGPNEIDTRVATRHISMMRFHPERGRVIQATSNRGIAGKCFQ